HYGVPVASKTYPDTTYVWAKKAGFDDKSAHLIASADLSADSFIMFAAAVVPGVAKYISDSYWQAHFNKARAGQIDSRISISRKYLEKAVGKARKTNYQNPESLIYLGKGLHSLQDIIAHGNLEPNQHSIWCDAPLVDGIDKKGNLILGSKRIKKVEELSRDYFKDYLDATLRSSELKSRPVKALLPSKVEPRVLSFKKGIGEIKQLIENKLKGKRPVIVYIKGNPATGKTTIVERIKDLFSGVCNLKVEFIDERVLRKDPQFTVKRTQEFTFQEAAKKYSDADIIVVEGVKNLIPSDTENLDLFIKTVVKDKEERIKRLEKREGIELFYTLAAVRQGPDYSDYKPDLIIDNTKPYTVGDRIKPREGKNYQQASERFQQLEQDNFPYSEEITDKAWVKEVLDKYIQLNPSDSEYIKYIRKKGIIRAGPDNDKVIYGGNNQDLKNPIIFLATNQNPFPELTLIHELKAIISGNHELAEAAELDYFFFETTPEDLDSKESHLDRVRANINKFFPKEKCLAYLKERIIQPNKIIEGLIPYKQDNGEMAYAYGCRAQHNNSLGAYKGGGRMSDEHYPLKAKDEACALSTEMSEKTAAAGLPLGGGKADIVVDPKALSLKEKARLSRGFIRMLLDKAGLEAIGSYVDIPAPDMNTDGTIMIWWLEEYLKAMVENNRIFDPRLQKNLEVFMKENKLWNVNYNELENPQEPLIVDQYIKLAKADPTLETIELATITGKPAGEEPGQKEDLDNPYRGGSRARDKATGQGGFFALRSALGYLGDSVKGKKVIIQGYGNVGSHGAQIMHEAGMDIVGIQSAYRNSKGKVEVFSIFNKEGIDIYELNKWIEQEKQKRKYPEFSFADFSGAEVIGNDDFWKIECDIIAPAARANEITEKIAKKVKAKYELELANGANTSQAESILLDKGIVIFVDIISNAGGVDVSFFCQVQNLTHERWVTPVVDRMLLDRIENSVERVMDYMKEHNANMREAAVGLSLRKIAYGEAALDENLEVFKSLPPMEPATSSLLNMYVKAGRTKEVINLENKKIDKQIDKVVELSLDKFGRRKTVRAILLCGPASSYKTALSWRIRNKLASEGNKVFLIDHDINRRRTIKGLIEGNQETIDIFDQKGKAWEPVQLDGDEILVIEGDNPYELAELFEKDCVIKVFVHAAPSFSFISGKRERKFIIARDLRFFRELLDRKNRRKEEIDGEHVLALMRSWPYLKNRENKRIYAFWPQADITINTALCYELAAMQPQILKLLKSAKAQLSKVKDRDLAEVLFKKINFYISLFEILTPISLDKVTKDSLPRQWINGKKESNKIGTNPDIFFNSPESASKQNTRDESTDCSLIKEDKIGAVESLVKLKEVLKTKGKNSRENLLIKYLKEAELLSCQLALMRLSLKDTYQDPEIKLVMSGSEKCSLLSKALSISLQRKDCREIAYFLNLLLVEKKESITSEAQVFINSYLNFYNITTSTKFAVCISLHKEQDRYGTAPDGQYWLKRKVDQLFYELAPVNPKVKPFIVFVNDGDDSNQLGQKTSDIIKKLLQGDYYSEFRNKIFVLNLSQEDRVKMHSRKHGALACGMRFALDNKAEVVIYTDGDPSMHLGLSGLLLGSIISSGNDLAFGSIRTEGAVHYSRPWYRVLGTVIYNFWVRFYIKETKGIKDTQRSFKAFKAEALEQIIPVEIKSSDEEGNLFINFDKDFSYNFTGDTDWLSRANILGFSQEEIPTVWIDSRIGKSMIKFLGHAFFMLRATFRQKKLLENYAHRVKVSDLKQQKTEEKFNKKSSNDKVSASLEGDLLQEKIAKQLKEAG
ncbi:MAG: hypothetical protein K9L71_04190, partial [Candidatus Omnitrophica bacterium]|nr:hypothetical protein [Candidatus Omnitrophota bacterium]